LFSCGSDPLELRWVRENSQSSQRLLLMLPYSVFVKWLATDAFENVLLHLSFDTGASAAH